MPDAIFTVDTIDSEFTAQNVRVRRQFVGKRRRLADRSNVLFRDGYHLLFRVDGDLIESTNEDPRAIQQHLEDPSKVVKIKILNTEYEVVSTAGEQEVFAKEFGSRSDRDVIECITKEIVTNYTEFER